MSSTEVELVTSSPVVGGDRQSCFGEAAVYEVAAVLDVAEPSSYALHEAVGGGEGDVGEPAASQE